MFHKISAAVSFHVHSQISFSARNDRHVANQLLRDIREVTILVIRTTVVNMELSVNKNKENGINNKRNISHRREKDVILAFWAMNKMPQPQKGKNVSGLALNERNRKLEIFTLRELQLEMIRFDM